MKRLVAYLLMFAVGLLLTGVFFPGFWQGQGLIGGDIYSYYFPQKAYYAEQLADGELPLWNNRVGHGYPVVAESQTGVFYPPNWIAYRIWDVNTAYNAVQVFHYALGFLFCLILGRVYSLSWYGSAMLGVVFIFGWFPARLSLEWAIITGCWMPAAVVFTERFFQNGRWRELFWLTCVLALQMLPGHYQLAFFTQVLIGGYAVFRGWIPPDGSNLNRRQRIWQVGGVVGALVLAFGLAALQLLPSWELKTLSQREQAGVFYAPGYGHLPVKGWSQIVAPFLWYGVPFDWNADLKEGQPPTNGVEAHLYFGLVPMGLIVLGMFRGSLRDRRVIFWGLVAVAALLYATGWFLPMTKFLPGFHFFRGVGRWSLLTTLGVACLVAFEIDRLTQIGKTRSVGWLLAGMLLLVTVVDLRIVRGLVGDAVFVSSPPMESIEQSPIREKLLAIEEPVRLLAPGPNVLTLLGVSAVPVYLGLAPQEYFAEETKFPGEFDAAIPPTREQLDWLNRAGVTHVLSFAQLPEQAWNARLVFTEQDPILNRIWARHPAEFFWIYELKETRGRVAWDVPEKHSTKPSITSLSANRVEIESRSEQPGTLILTDLDYPGWLVMIDDDPVESFKVDGLYRGVRVPAGDHEVTWVYSPTSQTAGSWISLITVMLLLVIATGRFRYSRKKIDENAKTPAGTKADGRRAG